MYMGVTKNKLCPVTLVLSYVHEEILKAQRSNGRYMTGQAFMSSLRTALVEAGSANRC